jgi:nitroimidazol reductase NimA-like FMN-containing flavoprotein (pyridoxamine 5'-phosphate oxidase superfamily)
MTQERKRDDFAHDAYSLIMMNISFVPDGYHVLITGFFSILAKQKIMFGNLNREEIEQVLHSQLVGRIGCHAEGTTYIVPISYAYDGEYIYAHTHEGMKIGIMRKDPKVCFEVENMTNMANWKTVICWGEFEEITREEDRHNALEKLQDRILPSFPSATTKLSPQWPFRPANTENIKGLIFRIRMTKKTGRFENDATPSFIAWG